MKEKLIDLLKNSYSPYSNFAVAAIVVMKDGKEFNGVNIENATYSATNCAERSAIFSAISAGYKPHDFERLYVMCDSDKIGTPCFNCRSVINEMFDENCTVIAIDRLGEERTFKVKDLCPYPFDKENLKEG